MDGSICSAFVFKLQLSRGLLQCVFHRWFVPQPISYHINNPPLSDSRFTGSFPLIFWNTFGRKIPILIWTQKHTIPLDNWSLSYSSCHNNDKNTKTTKVKCSVGWGKTPCMAVFVPLLLSNCNYPVVSLQCVSQRRFVPQPISYHINNPPLGDSKFRYSFP